MNRCDRRWGWLSAQSGYTSVESMCGIEFDCKAGGLVFEVFFQKGSALPLPQILPRTPHRFPAIPNQYVEQTEVMSKLGYSPTQAKMFSFIRRTETYLNQLPGPQPVGKIAAQSP